MQSAMQGYHQKKSVLGSGAWGAVTSTTPAQLGDIGEASCSTIKTVELCVPHVFLKQTLLSAGSVTGCDSRLTVRVSCECHCQSAPNVAT
jgi:hypothetical protein